MTTGMTYAEAAALSKGHPLRFLVLYSTPPMPSTEQRVRYTVAEAKRWLWLYKHPFGADLLACAETNS